jgi:hypothetical protein
MTDFKEQHICIKFYFKVGKTIMETCDMLKLAFGEKTMSRTQTFEWFSKFRSGMTSFEDNEYYCIAFQH